MSRKNVRQCVHTMFTSTRYDSCNEYENQIINIKKYNNKYPCGLHQVKPWVVLLFYCFSDPPVTKPCVPSPCGPNSACREVNGQAVCSCLPGYLSSPPSCRPECVVSSDCSLDKACTNLHCIDPCSGSCGLNAECTVINHNPICKCPRRYTGDPFTRCYPIRKLIYFCFLRETI